MFVRASLHMRREEKPTRCHWMVYCTYNMLNMFQELLCPSSGARDYMRVITAYGVRYLGYWLLKVRCRAAGYAFGMRDVARLLLTHYWVIPAQYVVHFSSKFFHFISIYFFSILLSLFSFCFYRTVFHEIYCQNRTPPNLLTFQKCLFLLWPAKGLLSRL